MWEIKEIPFHTEEEINKWLIDNSEWEPFNIEKVSKIKEGAYLIFDYYNLWMKREVQSYTIFGEGSF